MSKKSARKSPKKQTKKRPAAPAIRHGGKAGRDTFTEFTQKAFIAILRNRWAAAFAVLLLLAGFVGAVLLHRNSLEAEKASRREVTELRQMVPSPTVSKLSEWLEKYKGNPEESEVRLMLVKKYMELSEEKADPGPLKSALSLVKAFEKNFPDHPLATAPMVLGLPGVAESQQTFLEQLAWEIEKRRKILEREKGGEREYSRPFYKPPKVKPEPAGPKPPDTLPDQTPGRDSDKPVDKPADKSAATDG